MEIRIGRVKGGEEDYMFATCEVQSTLIILRRI